MNGEHFRAETRRITDADADIIATHMADKLVERLSDDETVAKLATVWSAQLDRHIGRTVRRGLYSIFAGLAIVVGVKLDAIVNWLRS